MALVWDYLRYSPHRVEYMQTPLVGWYIKLDGKCSGLLLTDFSKIFLFYARPANMLHVFFLPLGLPLHSPAPAQRKKTSSWEATCLRMENLPLSWSLDLSIGLSPKVKNSNLLEPGFTKCTQSGTLKKLAKKVLDPLTF